MHHIVLRTFGLCPENTFYDTEPEEKKGPVCGAGREHVNPKSVYGTIFGQKSREQVACHFAILVSQQLQSVVSILCGERLLDLWAVQVGQTSPEGLPWESSTRANNARY